MEIRAEAENLVKLNKSTDILQTVLINCYGLKMLRANNCDFTN